MSTAPAPSEGPRQTVASFDDYAGAERAVDYLSDQGFPVERLAIVGTDLRTVEQVTGRVTTGRAAIMGLGQGAFIGLFFALLFGLFFTGPGFFGLLVYAIVLGALLGAAFGALGHATQGGRRDFATVGGLQAQHYNVVADHEVAARASELLAQQAAGPAGV